MSGKKKTNKVQEKEDDKHAKLVGEYNKVTALLENCHEEHSDSIYNRRKDSPRSKSNYYSNLADKIDDYESQLSVLKRQIDSYNKN